MRIKQLTLQNIRSYENQTVEFPEGTILVHGENGTGKTSLLMGIFGGLFLSDITSAGNQSFNLDDLVRRGEDKAHVELVFEIDGADYTVEWTFYTTSTGPDATLRSPALSEPVSQVSNVKAKIQEILGMDKDDFSASVYVRQGEINRLIDADTRTELIDSLLNLDVIDEYITKMEGAKRGAGRIQRDNKRDRERAEQEIEEKYDRDEAQFEADINDLTEQIQDQESEKDEAEAMGHRHGHTVEFEEEGRGGRGYRTTTRRSVWVVDPATRRAKYTPLATGRPSRPSPCHCRRWKPARFGPSASTCTRRPRTS